MAERNLNIIINAKDNASKALGGLNNALERNKATIQKTTIAAAAAFAGITAAINSSIKAYQVQERAEARLAQLTKQTTNATSEQIQVLKDQASALQAIGVVGDEVTIFGQSQLATFALQTDAIGTLTPAMLDLVVATKGVNATQEDMINAGNMLGKVMGGQINALSRVGVVFSEAQAEILKTGTEMERAAALAEILQGNFGGLNEAMRETSEGQMVALQNTIGDIKETIGAAFIPVLAQLVEAITPVIERIAEFVEKNPEIVRNVGIAALAITGLIAVMGTLTLIFMAISAPALIVVGAIAGISLVFVALNNLLKTVGLTWGNVWEGIKSTTARVVGAVITLVESMINVVVDGINGIIRAINTVIRAASRVPGLGKKFSGAEISTISRVDFGGAELLRSGSFGGNNVNVTVNGDVSGEELVDKVSLNIMGTMGNNVRFGV